MLKAVSKVQGAPKTIRWKHFHDDDPPPLYSPLAVDHLAPSKMQANGHYFEPLEGYDSYDGQAYNGASPTSQGGGGAWKPTVNGPGTASYDDFEYDTPLEESASHQITLNTRVRAQNQDEVGQHLLYETALYDSQDYSILSITEVDALKKEHVRLNSRIEAAQRKLTLESKVKGAAQNLSRLYSFNNSKNRPDTPESPGSPRKSRSSLLSNKGRTSNGALQNGNGQTLHQAEDELATSVKKVDELHGIIKRLMERRQDVERKLYTHTAAVLAEQAMRPAKVANARRSPDEEDDAMSLYSPDEFDGIRDILHGGPGSKLQKRGNTQKLQQEHEQQLTEVQGRLEQLNEQLRHVIGEASKTRGKPLEPDVEIDDQSDNARTRLDNHFTRLEYNLRNLQNEHEESKAYHAQIQESSFATRNDVEEQLANINAQFHDTLLRSANSQETRTLPDPPQATGHRYEEQLHYLQDSLASMEKLFQAQQGTNLKASQQSQNMSEYETTVSGLWDIMQSDTGISRSNSMYDQDGLSPHPPLSPIPRSPLREDFSLPAFSSRVQHLFNQAQSAKEQQDILRRQIQQQRDLNGKSDMEKDRQLEELEGHHAQLQSNHVETEEELARVMAQHAKAESEASESRSELMNVMNEFDQIKRLVETRQQERNDVVTKHNQMIKDVEGLEGEVVRLTTELTMAKAELDSAYGSRAERAKESKAAEVDGLTAQVESLRVDAERSKALDQELREMTSEFQELTRESIELEKEREQLDIVIDELRDRCESLEGQLSDEKVRWLGVKSPGGPQEALARETTSLAVLRHEFKRMMREARAEGVKALRAEQEERKKLEAELRRSRQTSAPLSVKVNGLDPPGTGSSTLAPA